MSRHPRAALPPAGRFPLQRWYQEVTVGNGPAAGLDGYAAAIELLPRAAWRGVDRETRERVLADWTGLASASAACAIAAG